MLLVVPIQTIVALFLAIMVNRRVLKGRGIFRTAFYFPSVTSSVAITVLWLFLFSQSGAINNVLAWVGIHGPNWFNEPSGIIQDGLAGLGVLQGDAAGKADRRIDGHANDVLLGKRLLRQAEEMLEGLQGKAGNDVGI